MSARIVAIVLATLLAFGLTGCDGEAADGDLPAPTEIGTTPPVEPGNLGATEAVPSATE